MIANLEKEKDLHNSIDNYQNLIKLNNIIEKKFQNRFRKINQITKEKIDRIVNKKNEKKT